MAVEDKHLRRLRSAMKQPLTASRRHCLVAASDSRAMLHQLPGDSIDCVITSPPYGNLKNYGSRLQLGFGQHPTAEYLPDLRAILQELHRVVKPGGSVW